MSKVWGALGRQNVTLEGQKRTKHKFHFFGLGYMYNFVLICLLCIQLNHI